MPLFAVWGVLEKGVNEQDLEIIAVQALSRVVSGRPDEGRHQMKTPAKLVVDGLRRSAQT